MMKWICCMHLNGTNKRHHCVHIAPGIIRSSWTYPSSYLQFHSSLFLWSFVFLLSSLPFTRSNTFPILWVFVLLLLIIFPFVFVLYLILLLNSVRLKSFRHQIPIATSATESVQTNSCCQYQCTIIVSGCVILHGVWFCSIYIVKTKRMLSQSVSSSTSHNMTFLIYQKYTAWCLGKI